MGEVIQTTYDGEKGWVQTRSTAKGPTRDELDAQARELGLDPSEYKTKDDVQAAIDERGQPAA